MKNKQDKTYICNNAYGEQCTKISCGHNKIHKPFKSCNTDGYCNMRNRTVKCCKE